MSQILKAAIRFRTASIDGAEVSLWVLAVSKRSLARALSRRLHSRLPLACELLRLNDLRWGHFRGDRIAFFWKYSSRSFLSKATT